MSDNKTPTLFEFFGSKPTQAFIAIFGLLIAAFNLLIATRISPLANDISAIQRAVARLDETDRQFVPRSEIDAAVISRLDRIEDKLDRALAE